MMLQPRQQILEIWRALVQASVPAGTDETWVWEGREQANSISAAEQLLCLLYPATQFTDIRVDVPDAMADDVLDALRGLGDGIHIPKRLLDLLHEYLTTYVASDGSPGFSGGSYLQAHHDGERPTCAQLEIDVVESMSMSLTLSLSALGFVRAFHRQVRRADLLATLDAVRQAAEVRLTAALTGLRDSFTVRVFSVTSPQGRHLLSNLNPGGRADTHVLRDLHRALQPLRVAVDEWARVPLAWADSDGESMLFECGWCWSVPTTSGGFAGHAVGHGGEARRVGVAEPIPDLDSTVTALDGLADLYSSSAPLQDLLNAEQLSIANDLFRQRKLAMGYWSSVARLGSSRWPAQNIPWCTSEGHRSEHHNLQLAAIVVEDMGSHAPSPGEVTRGADLMEALAATHRSHHRHADPNGDDGRGTPLYGAESLGPALRWVPRDFQANLLKRTVKLAGLATRLPDRDRLLALSDDVFGQLWRTRVARGLWSGVDGTTMVASNERATAPSWYQTTRVVEGLVAATGVVFAPPPRSMHLIETVRELLTEADHLLGRELLFTPAGAVSPVERELQRVQEQLSRARTMLESRPATAFALAIDSLQAVERLTAAREQGD